jgi:hypothetical protein
VEYELTATLIASRRAASASGFVSTAIFLSSRRFGTPRRLRSPLLTIVLPTLDAAALLFGAGREQGSESGADRCLHRLVSAFAFDLGNLQVGEFWRGLWNVFTGQVDELDDWLGSGVCAAKM